MLITETARITFYAVQKCGFYAFNGKTPLFGGLGDTMEEIEAWTEDTPLSLTKITDPVDDEDNLPVYLMGIKSFGTDWVVGCWNEVPASEGGVSSVSRNSVVGSPVIHLNEVQKDTIPGYPSYFWIVPSKNVIATIRITNGPPTVRKGFEGYVRKFLALQSSYAIDGEDDDGEEEIIGYTDKDDSIPTKARPRFTLSPFAKKGKTALLLQKHASIKKVIRKGSVELTNRVDRTMFKSLIQFIRGDAEKSTNIIDQRDVRVELEYTPTLTELKEMITQSQSEDEDRWSDMGFEVKGESNTIWLSKSRASDTFELSVDMDESHVIELKSLATAIEAGRSSFLKLLKDA